MRALALLGIIVLSGLITVGGWWIKREVNSWLYYDDATIGKVCEMVKPEYLKDPSVCEEQE